MTFNLTLDIFGLSAKHDIPVKTVQGALLFAKHLEASEEIYPPHIYINTRGQVVFNLKGVGGLSVVVRVDCDHHYSYSLMLENRGELFFGNEIPVNTPLPNNIVNLLKVEKVNDTPSATKQNGIDAIPNYNLIDEKMITISEVDKKKNKTQSEINENFQIGLSICYFCLFLICLFSIYMNW